jgi:hypothetical protein
MVAALFIFFVMNLAQIHSETAMIKTLHCAGIETGIIYCRGGCNANSATP